MYNLGARIRKARELKNLKQDQLAELCEVSPATISNWELDHNEPSCDSLTRLAASLDVSLDYLLNYQSQKERMILDPDVEKTMVEICQLGSDFYDTIRVLVDEEKKRREDIQRSFDRHKPSFQIQRPLFLEKSDSEYAHNKKQIKNLVKLKEQSGKTDWQITEFLWAAGYNKDICYGDVISVLSLKIKVPNSQLLGHIQSYLEQSFNIVFPN